MFNCRSQGWSHTLLPTPLRCHQTLPVTGTWMVPPQTQTAMFWPTLALRWRRAWILPRSWEQKTLVGAGFIKMWSNAAGFWIRCPRSEISTCLVPQCSGEDEKVFYPSWTQMLLLNFGTWPTSSRWSYVSVHMKMKTDCLISTCFIVVFSPHFFQGTRTRSAWSASF